MGPINKNSLIQTFQWKPFCLSQSCKDINYYGFVYLSYRKLLLFCDVISIDRNNCPMLLGKNVFFRPNLRHLYSYLKLAVNLFLAHGAMTGLPYKFFFNGRSPYNFFFLFLGRPTVKSDKYLLKTRWSIPILEYTCDAEMLILFNYECISLHMVFFLIFWPITLFSIQFPLRLYKSRVSSLSDDRDGNSHIMLHAG